MERTKISIESDITTTFEDIYITVSIHLTNHTYEIYPQQFMFIIGSDNSDDKKSYKVLGESVSYLGYRIRITEYTKNESGKDIFHLTITNKE